MLAVISRGIAGWRKKEMLTVQAHLLARREGEREVPVRARLPGPWARSGAGPEGCPEPVFPFLFFYSFSVSFYFFITFAFWLQFDSNQIVNFPKIEQNISEQ
jgi:hypothetical protein